MRGEYGKGKKKDQLVVMLSEGAPTGIVQVMKLIQIVCFDGFLPVGKLNWRAGLSVLVGLS